MHHLTAATCFLKARCLKCGENHSHLQCNKIFDLNEDGKIKTLKCNKDWHLASWRGCENFPKKIVKNIRNVNPPRYVNQNLSFAAAARVNSNSNSNIGPNSNLTNNEINLESPQEKIESVNDILYILGEFQKIFGKANIGEIATKLRSTNDVLDKLQIFAQYLKP
ncbi:hypothetical protein AVEN_222464-1 [Araneus ventricosus]|uniref:Uncharacterized protein n=1 Tax=Araneus ventricosus TaxID=182803 RepID=A0A4Y2U3A7_ARAVE|nr:hypothetical protein AVEN_211317-1 [Araneus ventricosus]GBO06078.1 hypothetical protein AVEN_222464-1 [Araneus ventricosus]